VSWYVWSPHLVHAGTNDVQVEGLSEATKSYLPLPTIPEPCNGDETIPSFSNVSLPSKVRLIVHLDTDRPLSEPKWVKSGDVQEWLKSMFGRMFWVAGEAADGWEKKIEVADPDPVCVFPIYFHLFPTFFTRLLRSGLFLRVGRSTRQ